MHGFNNADKFMAQDALEGQVTACDFKIGVADSSQYETYKRFT